MKGYTELTVTEEVKSKLAEIIKTADDFIEHHKITAKGHWKTELSFFLRRPRKVWIPTEDIDPPFGVGIYKGWYSAVNTRRRSMPRFEHEEVEVINVSVDVTDSYKGVSKLLQLSSINSTVLVDDELAKVYNRVIKLMEK